MGLFGKKKEAEPIQQTTPAITHDGMYFEFHSAGKVDWTLSEDALTIVKKSLLATPGTYKLADITNVRHESHKGKFMPSNIFIKVSNGKEQQLCYFDEERQYGEQAYQYLVEHCVYFTVAAVNGHAVKDDKPQVLVLYGVQDFAKLLRGA